MGTPTATVTLTSNGGMSESYLLEHRISQHNEGANVPALPTCILPTDTIVLGDFYSGNDHYSTRVNRFGLHTLDACRDYAASMLLRTPCAHEYVGSGMTLPTININPSNIHT